ncbi:ParB N-terminal domain-containing protein [bacterium]|nr:ParB N-terminal domain-containing protein [bacterium]
MKRKEIRLNQIDWADERFRISYFFDLQPLVFSIKKIGVINPPVVTLGRRHYILVCGWKRVLACRELHEKKITVWVAERKTARELLLMSFYENWATREFSALEKAEIIKKLKDSGEKEQEITRCILPFLNIPSTLSYLDTYMKISRMDPEIKKEVYESNMGFKVLQLLVEFNPEEQKLLIPWLLPVGKNKQQEIIENIQEIACREDLSLSEIFQLPQVKAVSDSEKLSSVQKANKLREELVKIRFPQLSRRREAFHRWTREIQWPPDVDIYPAPYFEENWYRVHFRFKNKEEYERKIERLNKLNREKLSKLFHE